MYVRINDWGSFEFWDRDVFPKFPDYEDLFTSIGLLHIQGRFYDVIDKKLFSLAVIKHSIEVDVIYDL